MTLVGCAGTVLSAVFSAEGATVPTAFVDRTAKLWSTESRACLLTLESHADYVRSAVLSADGATVLIPSDDGTAKLWSTESGECLMTLGGHAGAVLSAVFSAERATVLTASNVFLYSCRGDTTPGRVAAAIAYQNPS